MEMPSLIRSPAAAVRLSYRLISILTPILVCRTYSLRASKIDEVELRSDCYPLSSATVPGRT